MNNTVGNIIKDTQTPPLTSSEKEVKNNEIENNQQEVKVQKETKPIKENRKKISGTEKKNREEQEKIVEKKESSIPDTIVEETGINLIPTMSREEIKDEDKKKKVNTSALISLSILFSVSILVIGFNILSKLQLNAEKDKLYEAEKRMEAYNQIIIDNNEIIERVFLYKDIQEGKFSTKGVIDYVQSISKKSGSSTLSDFSFTGDTGFSFSGEALDLEDVAKLWYLLTNDSRMQNINLKSVSKGEGGIRFSFTGDLKTDEFVSLSTN